MPRTYQGLYTIPGNLNLIIVDQNNGNVFFQFLNLPAKL